MKSCRRKSTKRWGVVAGLLLALFGAHAQGQEWPQRPIRIVIPGPPGGASDVPARLMAKSLGENLKQTVMVENRPGASGLIAAREVANAKPDGYTLLFTSGSSITISTGMMAEMASTVKKLEPLGMLAYTPLAVAVTNDSPFASIEQLIEAAREKPDTIVMANPGMFTLAHLTTELISDRAKAPLRAIAFNSFSAELVAVKSGDASAFIDGVGPILAQAGGNGLRILALSSPERPPGLEQYPLMKDTVPDTAIDGWFGLFAPAGLPKAVTERISTALESAKQDTKLASSLKQLGMYVKPDSPATFAAYVQAETELWHGQIAKLGMSQTKAEK